MALNSADRAQVDDGAEDTQGFPGGSVVKNPPANAGEARDTGLIPGSGRSSGGNDYPLQYSCLENSRDRGAWRLSSPYSTRGCKETDTTEHAISST